METSTDIKEIAAALFIVQSNLEKASKDAINPHYNKTYADLSAVWDACHDALKAGEVTVIQGPGLDDNGNVFVETMLLHKSGQFIKSRATTKPTRLDPQGVGIAITYLRRYGLAAMLGITQEDTDGNDDRKDKDAVKPTIPVVDAAFEPKTKPKATRGVDAIKQIDPVASGDTAESLLGEIMCIKSLEELETWGNKNANLIKKLPAPERDIIRIEYARKKSEFESLAA